MANNGRKKIKQLALWSNRKFTKSMSNGGTHLPPPSEDDNQQVLFKK